MEALGEGFFAVATEWGEGEVDFVVGSDLGDVSFELIGVVELFESLVGEEEAGEFLIDDRLVSEGGFGEDEEIDFLAFGVGWGNLRGVEESGDALGGDEAVAFGVEIDVDDDAGAGFWGVSLFGDGEEEVFGEAPIEEGAEVVGGEDFEDAKLAGEDFGRFFGGDGAVFGVAVDKDGGVDFVGGDSFSVGEEDFAEGVGIEEKSGMDFFDDGEWELVADVGHEGEVSVFFGRGKRCFQNPFLGWDCGRG